MFSIDEEDGDWSEPIKECLFNPAGVSTTFKRLVCATVFIYLCDDLVSSPSLSSSTTLIILPFIDIIYFKKIQ